MDLIIVIIIILCYYFIGAIVNGLMHRYDPYWFSNDSTNVGFVVQMWIIVVPLYWFAIFCDRCIYWFEKKEGYYDVGYNPNEIDIDLIGKA